MNINIDKKVINDYFYPLLTDYSHRYEVYYGGAGSGKSIFITQKILIKALSSKRVVLIVRKVLSSQLRSCWSAFVDMIDKWQLTPYCKINVSTYQITLPSGSILYFAGMDDREKIKSIAGITDIWCEECTELVYDDYSQLLLRCRANVDNTQIYCSFNPISKENWVYKYWFADTPKDYDIYPYSTGKTGIIIKSTYKDNKFLPQSYIDQLEDTINTNPQYYKIYVLGEFATLDKLVYPLYKEEEFDRVPGKHIVGIDFGYSNDTTAIISAFVDEENKTLYIEKEWGDTGYTNQQIAEVIKNMGLHKSVIVADSAEPKSIEELRQAGIYKVRPSVKGKDSILNGIQKIQQYKLIVHPRCLQTLIELQNYSWQKDKNTNEYINKPIDSYNHFMDALRYAIQSVGIGTVSTMDKTILGVR